MTPNRTEVLFGTPATAGTYGTRMFHKGPTTNDGQPIDFSRIELGEYAAPDYVDESEFDQYLPPSTSTFANYHHYGLQNLPVRADYPHKHSQEPSPSTACYLQDEPSQDEPSQVKLDELTPVSKPTPLFLSNDPKYSPNYQDVSTDYHATTAGYSYFTDLSGFAQARYDVRNGVDQWSAMFVA